MYEKVAILLIVVFVSLLSPMILFAMGIEKIILRFES